MIDAYLKVHYFLSYMDLKLCVYIHFEKITFKCIIRYPSNRTINYDIILKIMFIIVIDNIIKSWY